MKKTLIALAALGAAVSVHATNVTVYGVADAGFIKETGNDLKIAERINSRLGVKGSEDLGNGMKAIFQLEERFNIADGSGAYGGNDFEGAANVGLSGDFGKVRFGKMDELATEGLWYLDPFGQFGVGAMFYSRFSGWEDSGSGRIENSVRYDSPDMSGLTLGVSYTLGTATGANANDGYGISAYYTNGDLFATASYNKAADTNDGSNWNIGGKYTMDALTLSAAFEATDADDLAGFSTDDFLLGVSYKIGKGAIRASYNQSKMDLVAAGDDATDKQYAIGYEHNLSKRTSIYVDLAYQDVEQTIGAKSLAYSNVTGETSITSFQIGMTHRF